MKLKRTKMKGSHAVSVRETRMEEKKKSQRLSKHANKIDLSFEEAVRRLVNLSQSQSRSGINPRASRKSSGLDMPRHPIYERGLVWVC